MELKVIEQGRQFLLCLLGGMGLGAFLDILITLGKTVRFLRWITDLLVGMGLLVVNWLLFLYVGDGEYRIFFPVGVFAGCMIWKISLGRYFRIGCSLFWKILSIPCVKICRILKNFIKKCKKIKNTPFQIGKNRLK